MWSLNYELAPIMLTYDTCAAGNAIPVMGIGTGHITVSSCIHNEEITSSSHLSFSHTALDHICTRVQGLLTLGLGPGSEKNILQIFMRKKNMLDIRELYWEMEEIPSSLKISSIFYLMLKSWKDARVCRNS